MQKNTNGVWKGEYKKQKTIKVDHTLVGCVTEHGHPGHLSPYSPHSLRPLLCPLLAWGPSHTDGTWSPGRHNTGRFGCSHWWPQCTAFESEMREDGHTSWYSQEDKLPILMREPDPRSPQDPRLWTHKALDLPLQPRWAETVGHPPPSLTWHCSAHKPGLLPQVLCTCWALLLESSSPKTTLPAFRPLLRRPACPFKSISTYPFLLLHFSFLFFSWAKAFLLCILFIFFAIYLY